MCCGWVWVINFAFIFIFVEYYYYCNSKNIYNINWTSLTKVSNTKNNYLQTMPNMEIAIYNMIARRCIVSCLKVLCVFVCLDIAWTRHTQHFCLEKLPYTLCTLFESWVRSNACRPHLWIVVHRIAPNNWKPIASGPIGSVFFCRRGVDI